MLLTILYYHISKQTPGIISRGDVPSRYIVIFLHILSHSQALLHMLDQILLYLQKFIL